MRQLRTVRKSLTTESVKTLVQALIARRLDYCNSVFHRISADDLQALQSVLNAGARLITRKRKYEHITATLHYDLHWLPIRKRITYKLCTIVYKCLHRAAPSYLTEMCVPGPVAASTGCRCLCSAARGDLMNENDNIWIMQFCSFRTTCLEWSATNFAFIIHHTWTVPEQTKDNTI